MDNSIAKLLTTVYELEGLLLVVSKHGDDTPPEVIEALKSKAQAAHELAQLMEWHAGGSAEATETEAEPKAISELDAEAEATVIVEPKPDTNEDEVEAESFHMPEAKPEEAKPEETAVPADDDDTPCDEEDDNEEYCHDDDAEDDDEINEEDGIRVDEKLQRSISKDLRKAFSINDRFRFRRELFANSDIEMRDAIDMVECMHSAEEAEDYFYNDLNWEKTSPEVKDFMEIIKKHFA